MAVTYPGKVVTSALRATGMVCFSYRLTGQVDVDEIEDN